jgi:hypothetical protein
MLARLQVEARSSRHARAVRFKPHKDSEPHRDESMHEPSSALCAPHELLHVGALLQGRHGAREGTLSHPGDGEIRLARGPEHPSER